MRPARVRRWLADIRTPGGDLTRSARDVIPTDSAAKMAIAEVPTTPLPVLRDD
jgi:hypothetical protein